MFSQSIMWTERGVFLQEKLRVLILQKVGATPHNALKFFHMVLHHLHADDAMTIMPLGF